MFNRENESRQLTRLNEWRYNDMSFFLLPTKRKLYFYGLRVLIVLFSSLRESLLLPGVLLASSILQAHIRRQSRNG